MATGLGEMLVAKQTAEGYFDYRVWFPEAAGRPEPPGVTYSICAQA